VAVTTAGRLSQGEFIVIAGELTDVDCLGLPPAAKALHLPLAEPSTNLKDDLAAMG
jgi:hypothetical protein